LSLLAQFRNVDAALVASLSGTEEGRAVLKELEGEGVDTRYCKIWKDAGVPSAWVLHSQEAGTRSVINHNPLPDITHDDFIQLLGPLLAPENYPPTNARANTPLTPGLKPEPPSLQPSPRPSQSNLRPPPFLYNPNSPAPFDWLHFEGRSVKTTWSNMSGLDGLARERKWRSHCVFSLDVGRRAGKGVEALIPYADVLFLNKQYAQSHSPQYASTPRTFLLSLAATAPPHALLVAHWGAEGSAVLSLPTKEYFQSSGWTEEKFQSENQPLHIAGSDKGPRSVRSGSDFWAGDRTRTSSTAFTSSDMFSDSGHGHSHSATNSFGFSSGRMGGVSMFNEMGVRHAANMSGQYTTTDYSREHAGRRYRHEESDTQASSGVHAASRSEVVDEAGAHDAFIAGMTFALSRRLCPGLPYTPAWSGEEEGSADFDRGRWRLDECLRFATELSGRKARRKDWAGLADEMTQAGWFE